jgi:site-specific DNA recombinase
MQQPSTITRIALYARVSSEEQKEGQTIDSQIEELRRHAADRAWTIIEVYRDDGWSGGLLARPELDRLRDDAARSLFEAVLVNDVDRLARDVAHLGVIKRSLERLGIALIFRKLPAETSPMRNLMVNILGSFAEFEKEMIADRTRRGRRHKAEVRKQFVGGIAPYGYLYVEKGASGGEGELRVNQEEAIIVRRVYSWVDREGLSARAVVSRLNATRVRPRKGSTRWAKSSILRILRNETYAGVWHYNKHESVEPAEPGRSTRRYRRLVKTSNRLRGRADWIAVPLPAELTLVTTERWARVQNRLNQNITFSPRNARHFYLLRGLVRCAACDARFIGEPSHGQKFYYRCSKRCKRVGTVQELHLDGAVWTALEQAVLNPALIAKGVAALQEGRFRATENANTAMVSTTKALDQIRSEEERVLEAYRLAIISTEQLSQELKGIAARKKALEEQAGSSKDEERTVPLSQAEIQERILQFCQHVSKRLQSLGPEERQRLLRQVVEEIRFDGNTASIRAVIPCGESFDGVKFSSEPGLPTLPLSSASSDSGEIAATACHERGRNPSSDGRIAGTASRCSVRNPADTYEENRHEKLCFELIRQVEKDHSAARAASRANLVKASRARWPDFGSRAS